VIVRVLGSAAGGGVPQWNCDCTNCEAARAGRAARRTQSTLAVSPRASAGRHWFLFNCSSDIAAQIESFAPLQPQPARTTPIRRIFLTDANLDHIGGLAVLRSASGAGIEVRSTSAVREIAVAQPSFAHVALPPNRWIEMPLAATVPIKSDEAADDWLEVRALGVAATTPGYDGRRAVRGAVVAYEIGDRGSEKRLLFAPVFGAINDALAGAIASASVAFLDGTFFTDDEMDPNGTAPQRRARAMGHQPMSGNGGTLAQLHGARNRIVFTHLNNSNPMLDPRSEAYAAVRATGAEIAYDGMELTL
jgi:pyrroloquinoline quinone biosynthesis protein B